MKELIIKKDDNQITLMDKNDIESTYATKDEYIKTSDLTVEKQNNADSGNVSTYVLKYDGNQIGAKINIPKDFLVKSGEVKTATNADLSTLGNDFAVGDKYIDFIINTVDDDESDQHMYINVKDLVDSYNAGTGLTLSNNAFNVDYGTTAGTACEGNDSRLSDARAPIIQVVSSKSNLGDGIFIYEGD